MMSKTDFQTARVAMVDCQIRPADVTHYNIIDAMLKIPREDFFPGSLREIAYVGEHIRISDERYILDPRIIAKMLNLVNVNGSDLVLDVAGCFGYTASILSHFAQAVVMIEEPVFATEAERILVEQSIDNMIVKSGPLVKGANDYGPYDVVIIEGGVSFVPNDIVEQLKIGARIATIFINGAVGECRIGFKAVDGINWRFGFYAVAPVLKEFKSPNKFVF